MKHYDITSTWTNTLQFREVERMNIAISMIPKDCSSIIDLGSGNGELFYAIENSKNSIKKIKCLGYERSKIAVKLKKCKSKIKIRKNFKPIKNESQSDIVVSMAVLEHLKEAEIKSICKLINKISKKYLLINVPYKEKRVNVKCNHCNCCFDPYWHLQSFNIATIQKFFPKWSIKKHYLLKTKNSLLDHFIRNFKIVLPAKYGSQKICPLCDKISHETKIIYNKGNNKSKFLSQLIKQIFSKILKVLKFVEISSVSEVFILFERNNKK